MNDNDSLILIECQNTNTIQYTIIYYVLYISMLKNAIIIIIIIIIIIKY